MKWEKVKLGNVTDSCLGKMLDQNKNKGDYQPYLANVNVRWGEFDLEDLPLMKFEESEQERYELKYGDLVICEGGEPGRCAIWKEQIPNMKIQKALHRVRVHDCLDYRYLFYWFLLAGKTGELDQYFTGATIKHMPGQKLKETSVYKGYKQDKIEMRGDRAEMSDFPLYLNTVAGGLDRRDQTIGGFSFVVKIYAVPVVEIIGQLLYLLGRYGFNTQFGDCF